MQIVVPMAGLGQRFVDAGCRLPKPLISVDGVPMFARAVEELPPADRYVFVVHPDHVRLHRIDAVIADRFPGSRVLVTPGLTRGQACTVRLACEELDPRDSVLVAACDNSHLYDAEQLIAVTGNPDLACLIWTYRHDQRVLVRPTAHGWVETQGTSRRVQRVSCKVPLSQSPLDDHAISGCFWFRDAELLQTAIDAAVEAGDTVNGEFYLDTIPNRLVQAGEHVEVFEVEKYIGWGTPQDLDDYGRWQRYFARNGRPAGRAGHAPDHRD